VIHERRRPGLKAEDRGPTMAMNQSGTSEHLGFVIKWKKWERAEQGLEDN